MFRVAVGGFVATIFSANYTLNQAALDVYQLKLAHFEQNQPSGLTPGVQTLSSQVMDEMKINPDVQKGVEVFTCNSKNPVHRGLLQPIVSLGAINVLIGLPVRFGAATDTTSSSTKSENEEPTINDIATSHAASLSLNAQRFVIARELAYSQQRYLYVNGALKSVFGGVTFAFGSALLLTRKGRGWVPYLGFGLVAGGAYLFYAMLHDTHQCFCDRGADDKAGSISDKYAVGGIEYYNSVLTRNMNIRTRLGAAKGPKTYTRYGNEVSAVRRKNEELTTRRDHLKKIYASFQEKS